MHRRISRAGCLLVAACLATGALADSEASRLWKVGKERMRAQDAAGARQAFEAALARKPGDPTLLFGLGSAAWLQRDRDVALAAWWRAVRADPESEARPALETLAPRLLAAHHLVTDQDEWREVLRFEADFRRQAEVDRAFHRFTTQKGLTLAMQTSDFLEYVKAFVELDLLDHPGGPPSGEGQYFTAANGSIRSTVFGSRDDPIDPPEALRPGTSYAVLPGVLVSAIEAGDPRAAEFGLARLEDADLVREADRLAPGLTAAAADPWAAGAVVDRVRALLQAGRQVPDGLVDVLAEVTAIGNAEARSGAATLLELAGAGDRARLPASDLGDVDDLVDEVLKRREGPVRLLAALRAAGASAGPKVTRWIHHADPARSSLGFFLANQLRFPGAAEAILKRLEAGGVSQPGWAEQGYRALGGLVGEDHGDDLAAWRRAIEAVGH